MFRRAQLLSALACLAAPGLAFAQAATGRTPPSLNAPTPSVTTQPQAQSGSVSTLKATSQLVIVDVLVTDAKQQPVHNLKAADFALTENGAPQQISAFEEHVTPPPSEAAKAPQMPKLPPGIFTNYTPVPAGSAVNVLLLDALNTPMKDQAYVRDQLREFLKNTPPGTRIAIFGLNDRLVMLQGFTTDLALLKSVIDRSSPASSRQLPDNVGNGGTPAPSDMIANAMGDASDMTTLLASVQQFEAVQGSVDVQNRVIQTMQAVNQIAHFLSGIPGRKNLIWFSGSFPLDIFPDNSIANPSATVVNMQDAFHETTNLLTRAQVAVYPIDAGGLQTNNVPIANDSSPTTSSGSGLSSALAKQFVDRTSRQGTMYQIAADTGGRAYIDANSLSKAVGTAIESGSNFYTLSYVPSNSAQDGKFRKIQVKLAQQGFNLTYRSGYYADEPAGKSKRDPELAALSTPSNSLTRAMMRGAPGRNRHHAQVAGSACKHQRRAEGGPRQHLQHRTCREAEDQRRPSGATQSTSRPIHATFTSLPRPTATTSSQSKSSLASTTATACSSTRRSRRPTAICLPQPTPTCATPACHSTRRSAFRSTANTSCGPPYTTWTPIAMDRSKFP